MERPTKTPRTKELFIKTPLPSNHNSRVSIIFTLVGQRCKGSANKQSEASENLALNLLALSWSNESKGALREETRRGPLYVDLVPLSPLREVKRFLARPTICLWLNSPTLTLL